MPVTPVHASCVALGDRAVLIRGAAGAGKSTLALTLMAYGCDLIVDDRVILTRDGPDILATPHPEIAGMIEARGIGILNARLSRTLAHVILAVDLDTVETERLPPVRQIEILGKSIDLLYKVEGPQFAPGIFQFLKSGRNEAL